MMAIIFALISLVGWALGDLFQAVAARKIGAYSTTFWVFCLGWVVSTLYLPFALAEIGHITTPGLLLNIFLGSVFIAGTVCFNEALRVSNVSLVGATASSFPALVVVLSVIFLKETITLLQGLSILTIFVGILLSILDLRELKTNKFVYDRGPVLALLTMISWAIYFTFIKILIRQFGWFWPNYISLGLFPLIFVFTKLVKIKLRKPYLNRALLPLLAAAFLLRGGDFSFNLGISHGLTAIVAPIAGGSPALFVVLAFLIFKDPIKKQQVAGVITTLTGILSLSLISSS